MILDPECETGQVRLVGGLTISSGRLEVCGNRVWGNVCNYLRYWGPDNAAVVCRQLGFSEVGKTRLKSVQWCFMSYTFMRTTWACTNLKI